jgi:translation initiation factor 2B subunit (eIF-2B alpha/beta/delta family)
VFERIAEDKELSPLAMAMLAAEELAESVQSWDAADPGSFWNDLMAACRSLVDAGRGTAPAINLASRVLASAEKLVLSGLAADAMRLSVIAECEASHERLEDGLLALGRLGSCSIPGDAAIGIAGCGDSVMAVLSAAQREGKRFDAIVPVASGAEEESDLLESLLEQGIGAVPTVEGALSTLVGTCSTVIVGVESVSEDDFTSSPRTPQLLRAARDARVPARLAALTDELIPVALRPRELGSAQDATRRGAGEAGSVTVPLSLIDEIITENGSMKPSEVAGVLAVRPVAPPLLEVLFGAPRAHEY